MQTPAPQFPLGTSVYLSAVRAVPARLQSIETGECAEHRQALTGQLSSTALCSPQGHSFEKHKWKREQADLEGPGLPVTPRWCGPLCRLMGHLPILRCR